MTKVSFVIPSHNCDAWLPHAVESVMDQTYRNVEAVVVDDASKDTTPKYLAWAQKEYGDRLKVIRNGKNKGRSASRNAGNALASGDIICVLDADDIAFPKRAELTVKKLRKGVEFVYGGAVTIDALGIGLAEIEPASVKLEKCLKDGYNGIVHSTVGYTADFAKSFPYRGGEIAECGIDDWAQQIEALAAGKKFDFIGTRLSAYRQLPTGISKIRDEKRVRKAKDAFLADLGVLV